MLQKIFTKPVELHINDRVLTFKSLDDFEFSLNPRTAVPLERITEAINSAPGELDMEANVIMVALEQFSELNDEANKNSDITQRLKSINPVSFSSDNGWRDIFFALKREQSPDSSEYKKIALKSYLKYLSNRLEVIQTIKSRLEKEGLSENAEPANFRTGELEIDEQYDAGKLANELGMASMPKAETVFFKVKEGDVIELLLANYKCRLIIKNDIKFIDHEGKKCEMIMGLNKIGRSSDCKVRFNDTTQRISRTHLLIINNGDGTLELTDLSKYGTFFLQKTYVPAKVKRSKT